MLFFCDILSFMYLHQYKDLVLEIKITFKDKFSVILLFVPVRNFIYNCIKKYIHS